MLILSTELINTGLEVMQVVIYGFRKTTDRILIAYSLVYNDGEWADLGFFSRHWPDRQTAHFDFCKVGFPVVKS